MADDLYIKKLERDAERTNILLTQLGDLVDEGAVTSSAKSAHLIFAKMGTLLGMNMNDLFEEIDPDEDEDEELYD